MAILKIPTSQTLPDYTETVTLDGTRYDIRFIWNQREEYWYFTISTNDELVIGSTKIVPNWPLLRREKDTDTPPGIIYAFDTTGNNGHIGFEDLGTKFILLYADEAEIEEQEAAVESA